MNNNHDQLAPDGPMQHLLGRKLRVLRPGDMRTMDHVPGRVNMYLNQDGRIERIEIEGELAFA